MDLTFLLFLLLYSAVLLFSTSVSVDAWISTLIIFIVVYYRYSFQGMILIMSFYAIGEVATIIRGFLTGKEHKQRNYKNIIGNVLPSVIAAVINNPLAFAAGLSSALADTLASEIGMLSKKDPIDIVKLKRVKKGTDGAISSLGLLASLFGAVTIGIGYYLLFPADFQDIIIITLLGFVGSIVDSYLGATLQRKRILNNWQVNLCANFIVMLIGMLF